MINLPVRVRFADGFGRLGCWQRCLPTLRAALVCALVSPFEKSTRFCILGGPKPICNDERSSKRAVPQRLRVSSRAVRARIPTPRPRQPTPPRPPPTKRPPAPGRTPSRWSRSATSSSTPSPTRSPSTSPATQTWWSRSTRDALTAVGNSDRFHTDAYDALDGVSVDTSGLVDLVDAGVTRETLLDLDPDVYLMDPNWLTSTFELDRGDIDFLTQRSAPFLGNTIFRRTDAWHDYDYYSLYEAFETVAELFDETDRFDAFQSFHDSALDRLETALPSEGHAARSSGAAPTNRPRSRRTSSAAPAPTRSRSTTSTSVTPSPTPASTRSRRASARDRRRNAAQRRP